MTARDDDRRGKIVTFYSYKGGTGRSMALANVAFLLASAGKRVLAVDWDLEAPGLHRYFEPFLADRSLEHSTGVIDFVRDFATAALARGPKEPMEANWYEEYADLLAHAVPLAYEFENGGALHLVPAGKQDASYGVRVNAFDWESFYARLGGGILLEAVKANLRRVYDFVLIDSRTGVSDTSGICTIQMPDELVVCFTLNRQSIYGASAAARLAFVSRHGVDGNPTLKIWPVPMRVEYAEKDRMEIASTLARVRFSGLMSHFNPNEEELYWGEIPVAYEPYYAYEEVLSLFRDRPRQRASLLARMETIAGHLNGEPLKTIAILSDGQRAEGLAAFTGRSALTYVEELAWLADEYERIRQKLPPGRQRTSLMAAVVDRTQILAGERDAAVMAEKLFAGGMAGDRIVGLALAQKEPQRQHLDLALQGIASSRSAFEQYNALILADAFVQMLPPEGAAQLRGAIDGQFGKTIDENDPSRFRIAQALTRKLSVVAGRESRATASVLEHQIDKCPYTVVTVTPPSRVLYADVAETHGRWVTTRGTHPVILPRQIVIGQCLVTNALFMRFVAAGGYANDAFWNIGKHQRLRLVTSDGTTGPGNWPSASCFPGGEEEHPVSSISFVEALAFVAWCNEATSASAGLQWSLPTEDYWEFAARSEEGFVYPWGDAFDQARCNSRESGFGKTSPVRRYENGVSRAGCYDMAGNVWEFVLTEREREGSTCVLRGGSFSNNHFEVRSYLRLFGVPVTHRPPDFGFRLALIEAATG
jgi:formylglycine-generating enzyme required for sulfatase activity